MSTEEMSEITRVMITIIYLIKANFMAINYAYLSFWTIGQLSKEERIRVAKFYLQNGSVVQTQRKFKAHFKTKKAPPTRKTIVSLAEYFLSNGTVQNQNSGNSGRENQSWHRWKLGRSHGE